MPAKHTDMWAIAFTTSIRTPHGHLLVHVRTDALVKLGSKTPDDALLILSRSMPQMIDAARQLAARAVCNEVVIGAQDI